MNPHNSPGRDSHAAERLSSIDFGQAVQCPICSNLFNSAEDICAHLSDDPGCSHRLIPPPIAFRIPQASEDRPRQGRFHHSSGYIHKLGQPNTFKRMEQDDFEPMRKHNVYYPFSDRAEWELAKFLCDNLNQGQITRFLKLLWVVAEAKRPLSFKTAKQLFTFMDTLPKVPQWRCTPMHTDGYATTHPVNLIWRDALEVVHHIFGNPIFANHMEYDPYEINDDGEREYGEWMSCEHAFEIQDKLPIGATIVPIILTSDKTPVTRHTGSLEMHPTFLTIGNIHSEIRMKATSHAWECVAYIPSPEYITNSDYAGLLEARFWHSCMDMVFEKLKIASHMGELMVDPMGCQRYAFTPLIAHVADLPEQLMISCVSKSVSPTTLATLAQFDDSITHPPRNGMSTLLQLHEIGKVFDPWKFREFQEAAKKVSLSGVHKPFWRDWKFADPAVFLVPEILHTGHKFFFDHILKWCKEVIGANELDARFRSQHKRVGTRHFTDGVSHVNQMTGREHRDIQRTLVPTIVGVTSPGFTRAVRALIDFIYKAQAPTFTDSSINSMSDSLREFHTYKHFILEAQARTGTSGPIAHFRIPKLELFNSFARSIRKSGAIIQYSADVSERLLITHCKTPFQRTSHQRATFTQQVVNIIHRQDVMRQFDFYALLREQGMSLVNVMDDEFDEVVDMDPTFSWIARVAPQEMQRFQAIRPVRNHFLKGLLSDEANAAFHVTIAHDLADRSATALAQLYHLPNFPHILSQYLDGVSGRNSPFHSRLLKVWFKFRLQLHSRLRPCNIMPSQQVQAIPPSNTYPYGYCDIVLLQPTGANPQSTPCIAQVRMVFALSTRGSQLPVQLKDPFLYVQLFEVTALPEAEPHIAMYRVRRSFYTAPDGSRTRIGKIVRLVDVTHAVELIPIYGTTLDRSVTSVTSLERYDDFYLNSFSDKEWYHTLHADYI
ncbi:uncharacterized protein HD556DRAFT_1493884 [Suillus plorans]|uniref:DUF6830 domain-containing protein n=1 Tax=Suillus plorans TaxID=116603 RepID=A0A9P7DSL9_9AGAM|nr:uncharacterized protein HD556DRAFT_1493884 [Suillus plorans]KAG1802059.1 hypothetical protein HD556DRAFT_1493884 [Suillus plorans]